MSTDLNLAYDILPFDNLSPFIYAGFGALITDKKIKDNYFKFQYGGGIEYLPIKKIGIKVFAEQNILFSDKLEGLVKGKWNDYYWRLGVGLNFYVGKPYERIKSVIFE